MHRAKTAEEYVELIRQALIEVEELRASFEWDLDDMSRIPGFLDPLEQSLAGLLRKMEDGTYIWADGDLPFMPLVRRNSTKIPFADLLDTINETHLKGLDVEQAGS
ncbi:MAG: general secretion pathway protein GspF [Gammaproteobacteria bacterium]|nr:general secretion pathway protein GspF [Gammaproteobacteria bacterium]